jgi:hypothetical protein
MKLSPYILAAVGLALASSGAQAVNVYANPGANLDFIDADTITDNFLHVNYNPLATSVYTERSDGFGVNAADGLLKNGEILNFSDQGIINLSSLTYVDGMGNLQTLSGLSGDSTEGITTSWTLQLRYNISGYATAGFTGYETFNSLGASTGTTTTSTINIGPGGIPVGTRFLANEGLVPVFQTGMFDYYLVDPSNVVPDLATGDKVLELDLTNYVFSIPNLELDGKADYSGAWFTGLSAAKQAAVKNFFSFANPVGGLSRFYDIWEAGVNNVSWQMNTNVTPNLIPRSAGNHNLPGGSNPACAAGTFCRSTTLNLDFQFNPTAVTVPEPGALSLMGVGLIGAFFSRRNSRKTS